MTGPTWLPNPFSEKQTKSPYSDEEDAERLLTECRSSSETLIGKEKESVVPRPPTNHLPRLVLVSLLTTSIALLFFIILFLVMIYMEAGKAYGAFEKGFDTDLGMLLFLFPRLEITVNYRHLWKSM
jgi:hypothetical protein